MERRNFLARLLTGVGTLGLLGPYGSATALAAEPAENTGPDDSAGTSLGSKIYATADYGAFSILQGVTSREQTQLNVVLPIETLATYRLIDQDTQEVLLPTRQSRATRPHSGWAAENVFFDGLSLGPLYAFEVVGAKGEILDRRELQAFDTDDWQRGFAIISCCEDHVPQAKRDAMWDSLAAVNPGLLLLIGDAVYGAEGRTQTTPDHLWDRYVEVRQLKLKFFHQKRLIPTVSVWDDHDFGANNGDHTYEYKDETLKIFNAFYAQDPIEGVFERGPGASSWFRGLGLHFQLMDGRYFKGTPGRTGEKSQWGSEQETWMLEKISKSDRPVFLVNGTLYFDTMVFSENYEKEFNKSFNWLKDTLKGIRAPILFASGDVHWSEISRVPERILGYETFEIVSSGMHTARSAMAELLLPLPSVRRIKGAYHDMFTVVRPTLAPGISSLEVTAYREQQHIQYQETLIVRR